jgi:hypothetical protein|tara:strand:- start:227 stop:487 length:261 start_codon:yes stop_codon:yes gene_type:complete
MEQQKSKIVDLSPYLKKKIYNEFNVTLYKEFNQTIFDINYIFGYEEEHLFEVLEEAFDEGGPIKMRKEIDYTIQSFKLDFNKNNII